MAYSEPLKNDNPKCPLCNRSAVVHPWRDPDSQRFYFEGKCDVCGHVRVLSSAVDKLKGENRVYLLSAFFRRRTQGGEESPIVTPENVDDLLSQMPTLKSVADKLDALLRSLVELNPNLGTPITFKLETDYPLIFAANEAESRFLFDQLVERRFVKRDAVGRGIVTADGYERLEQLDASSYKTSRNAFVAMWFDKSLDSIYKNAIEPAIHDAGYEAIRIDKTEHLNRIDDEIIAQLRQCRFEVADFTGQRAGVYFEAGFMLGLGRNVYWMCQKSDLKKAHFDTRQYNFIDYESPEEARERLYNRIMAIEGKGPGKPAS